MRDNIKRLITYLSIIALTIIISFTIYLSKPDIPRIKQSNDTINEVVKEWDEETQSENESVYEYSFNENIAGIRITDIIGKVGAITKVNYKPNEFCEIDKAMKNAQIVDLNDRNFSFAKRGTLQFIILGPKPDSSTYNEDIKKIEKFKSGDYWQLTLAIPNIFTASNIYYGYKLVASNGSIKDYNFIKNSATNNKVTDEHKQGINSTNIDLEFFTSRITMDPNKIPYNSIITIHYELLNNSINPINNLPIIGLYESVVRQTRVNLMLHIILASISTVIMSIFLFISFIKNQKKYIPLILTTFGLALYSISYLFLNGETKIPLFWISIKRMSPIFTVFIGMISILIGFINKKSFKIVLYNICGLFLITMLLPIIINFVGISARHYIELISWIILFIISAAGFGFMLYGIIKKNKILEFYLPPTLVSIAVVLTFLMDRTCNTLVNPIFWIDFIIALIIFAIFLKIYIDLEKRNNYLTENLKTEIDIHTNELVKALNERNKILQFITHDLKKPAAYYTNTLNKLKNLDNNTEYSLELLNNLIDKSNEVKSSLNRIAEYSKLNFLNEKISIINVKDYIGKIYKSIKPDCDAAGVYLTLLDIPSGGRAFCKEEGLQVTIMNIIFNALEHAEAHEITIKAKQEDSKMVVLICDDGKGIPDGIDIFKPYVSEIKGGSHGLGLYICKEAMESMNGKISFKSSPSGTEFRLELLSYID